MRLTAGSGQDARMAATDRIRVILGVKPDADPITGVAMGSDGASRVFCGWTDLTDIAGAAPVVTRRG